MNLRIVLFAFLFLVVLAMVLWAVSGSSITSLGSGSAEAAHGQTIAKPATTEPELLQCLKPHFYPEQEKTKAQPNCASMASAFQAYAERYKTDKSHFDRYADRLYWLAQCACATGCYADQECARVKNPGNDSENFAKASEFKAWLKGLSATGEYDVFTMLRNIAKDLNAATSTPTPMATSTPTPMATSTPTPMATSTPAPMPMAQATPTPMPMPSKVPCTIL